MHACIAARAASAHRLTEIRGVLQVRPMHKKANKHMRSSRESSSLG
jgi:hypothetical protein